MSGEKRNSSPRRGDGADWLGRDHPARVRRWALEEQLLGPHGSGELAERLRDEQVSLSRLEQALHDEMDRIAELEREVASAHAEQVTVSTEPSTVPIVSVRAPGEPSGRGYELLRCHGFVVDAPAGEVGIVSGLRFGSRLDRPDFLEIEVGRLRRQIVLVPVEEVEGVWLDEGRLTLAADPRRHPYRESVHAIVVRLRGRPRVSPS